MDDQHAAPPAAQLLRPASSPVPGRATAAPTRPPRAGHRHGHRAGDRDRPGPRWLGTPSATASPAAAQTASSGSSQSKVATGGSGGTTPIPGNGGWSWSDGGQGGLTLPTDPYGGQSRRPGHRSQGQGRPDTTTKASGSQLTGLVRIATTMKYDGGKAAGTGMVLTSDGEVVTNHHVVAGATSIKVKVMSTGKTYTAKVVGTDAKDDVAVLQLVGASGLSTVTPDTDGIAVGDEVTAVGDANGTVELPQRGHRQRAREGPGDHHPERGQRRRRAADRAAADQLRRDLRRLRRRDVRRRRRGRGHDHGGVERQQRRRRLRRTRSPRCSGSSTTWTAGSRRRATTTRLPAFLGVALGETAHDRAGRLQGHPGRGGRHRAGRPDHRDRRSTEVSHLRGSCAGRSRPSPPVTSVAVTWTDSAGASHTETVTLAEGPIE